jgi:hypothetical protein
MSALAPTPKFPTVKFPQVGARFKGTITRPTEDRQAKKFGTEILDFWPDGQPVMQTKVVLRDSQGAEWALYAKGKMASAITRAISAAGASDLAIGGELEVIHNALGEAKAGGQPPKLYTATYAAPSGAAASSDPWDDEEPPF